MLRSRASVAFIFAGSGAGFSRTETNNSQSVADSGPGPRSVRVCPSGLSGTTSALRMMISTSLTCYRSNVELAKDLGKVSLALLSVTRTSDEWLTIGMLQQSRSSREMRPINYGQMYTGQRVSLTITVALVEAIDSAAAAFSTKNGFAPPPSQTLKLLMPVSAIM